MADRSIYEIAARARVRAVSSGPQDDGIVRMAAGMVGHIAAVDAVVRETLAEVERRLAEEHELHPATEAALVDARTALIGANREH